MFVGHYSAALAAKAAEPRGPLWAYVAAAQLVDIGWSALVMAGVEKVRVDPSLPGSSLDLYHMPWTHSLPAAIAWSVAAAAICRWGLKWPGRVSGMVGAVVFSHWILDWLVHRPDLALWPGGTKVGLGLWNYPVPEQAVEIGLLGLAGMLWAASAVRTGKGLMAPVVFFSALVALQIAVMFAAPEGDTFQLGLSALIVYLLVTGFAWLLDRGPKKGSRRR